ncbi:MAG: hypothetical protein VX620_15335 [Pseudomonadota bacterium]|nr:hypothetical protein [Pseudomonadota bacterium]
MEAQTKHTPGPWKSYILRSKAGRDLGWIVEHSNGRIAWTSLAYADTNKEADKNDPAREANARLIAAAPDLLNACKAVFDDVASIDNDSCLSLEVGRALKAAIAKAEGMS